MTTSLQDIESLSVVSNTLLQHTEKTAVYLTDSVVAKAILNIVYNPDNSCIC